DRESPERRSELRAYGSALYNTTIRPGSATPKKARAGASTAECLLAKLSVPYNQTALEIRGSMGECWKHDTEMTVNQTPWEWSNSPDGRVELRNHDYTDSYTDGQDLVLSSQFPGLRWPRQPSDWLPLVGVAAALGLLLPGMWWLIGSSTSKVFLLDPIRTFI